MIEVIKPEGVKSLSEHAGVVKYRKSCKHHDTSKSRSDYLRIDRQ